MPITHVRDMDPPVRELIPEFHAELVSPPVREVFKEVDGVLVRDGKTEPGAEYVFTPVLNEDGTPHLVESYQTLDDDGVTVRTHEGSMKAVDLSCRDCGADLKPGNNGAEFYYLVCSRIDDRNHQLVKASPVDEQGNPRTHVLLDANEMAEPYANSVLECGRAGL